ncbi:hypothetical protein M404DRAFT_24397 [Pisolithus tinctorius Marx 270]|uniref:Uncharacterized protein n=1 Tax=Pisolithus tinctorius Marx 270 TaxID=870435 RepID=A0A0C3KAP2_PISTI|nr:hypothetical protein M404DRAFT_24397 [Pisolithus tinctorius Marx 270]
MVDTRASTRRAMRARASSLPPSPLMAQPGADIIDNSPLPKLTPLGSQYSTPIERPVADNVWSYSDMNQLASGPRLESWLTNVPWLEKHLAHSARLENYLAEVPRTETPFTKVSWLENQLTSKSRPMTEGKEPPITGNHKGKGPDPRNWGDLDLSDGEMDPEAQRAALASWNVVNKLVYEGNDDLPEPSQKAVKEGAASNDEDAAQSLANDHPE